MYALPLARIFQIQSFLFSPFLFGLCMSVCMYAFVECICAVVSVQLKFMLANCDIPGINANNITENITMYFYYLKLCHGMSAHNRIKSRKRDLYEHITHAPLYSLCLCCRYSSYWYTVTWYHGKYVQKRCKMVKRATTLHQIGSPFVNVFVCACALCICTPFNWGVIPSFSANNTK